MHLPCSATHLDAGLSQLQCSKQASGAAAHNHHRLCCCPAAPSAASGRCRRLHGRVFGARLLLLALEGAGPLLQPPQAGGFEGR